MKCQALFCLNNKIKMLAAAVVVSALRVKTQAQIKYIYSEFYFYISSEYSWN